VAAVTRIGNGVYRVDDDGRQAIVYVAGAGGDLWAFWNGEVYREQGEGENAVRSPERHDGGRYDLTAPMPATVVKILVSAGQTVKHGETLVVLEAMKMELPIRAPADAVVQAVNCREGELVQPERTLVELA
jgi:3-methylcrotonyl-CoA carboxylase alpha subunit